MGDRTRSTCLLLEQQTTNIHSQSAQTRPIRCSLYVCVTCNTVTCIESATLSDRRDLLFVYCFLRTIFAPFVEAHSDQQIRGVQDCVQYLIVVAFAPLSALLAYLCEISMACVLSVPSPVAVLYCVCFCLRVVRVICILFPSIIHRLRINRAPHTHRV